MVQDPTETEKLLAAAMVPAARAVTQKIVGSDDGREIGPDQWIVISKHKPTMISTIFKPRFNG